MAAGGELEDAGEVVERHGVQPPPVRRVAGPALAAGPVVAAPGAVLLAHRGGAVVLDQERLGGVDERAGGSLVDRRQVGQGDAQRVARAPGVGAAGGRVTA